MKQFFYWNRVTITVDLFNVSEHCDRSEMYTQHWPTHRFIFYLFDFFLFFVLALWTSSTYFGMVSGRHRSANCHFDGFVFGNVAELLGTRRFISLAVFGSAQHPLDFYQPNQTKPIRQTNKQTNQQTNEQKENIHVDKNRLITGHKSRRTLPIKWLASAHRKTHHR